MNLALCLIHFLSAYTISSFDLISKLPDELELELVDLVKALNEANQVTMEHKSLLALVKHLYRILLRDVRQLTLDLRELGHFTSISVEALESLQSELVQLFELVLVPLNHLVLVFEVNLHLLLIEILEIFQRVQLQVFCLQDALVHRKVGYINHIGSGLLVDV